MFLCLFFPASRTVQTDAHTASKEEEQTQAQTPSTTGPITTRYGVHKSYIYRDVINVTCFQTTDLHLFDLTETPSDSDPKKKKKKRDDDPDRKKKKKDKKKKKVRQSIKTPVNPLCFFMGPNAIVGRDKDPYPDLIHAKPISKLSLKTFNLR